MTVLSVVLGGYGLQFLWRSWAFVGILVIGENIVLSTGGIDLSIQAVYVFSGLFCSIIVNQWEVATPVAVAVGLVLSAGLGFVNGFIITRFELSPYLATIGTLGIINGICKLLSAMYPILYLPTNFTLLGQGQVWGIPIPFVIWIVLLLAYHILFSKSMLGRYISAVGSNEWAAQMSGIPINTVKITAYTLCSLLVGLSGILEVSRVGFSWPSTQPMLMLGIIAAAMAGMNGIKSSKWKVLGVVLGTILITSMEQCLALFQLLAWEDAFMGCAILFIVFFGRRRLKI